MALVTTTEMFKKAYEGGYAIGAFNVNNMEIVQGITEAAGELKSPLILQVSAGARKYANHTYLVKLVEAALAENDIPIALHLDHGADFEICKSCIDGGFTSVMIDGSHHSFEDNIELTKRVVDYAHSKGCVVEGELGQLAGIEDDVNVSAEDAQYTRPEEVEEFVDRTGVTLSLSLSVQATVHSNSNRVRNRSFVSTSLMKSPDVSRTSRSFFMVHPAFLRNTLRSSRLTAETFRMLSVFRKICFVRQLNLLYVRSTSTLTFVLL
jgi:ketose-bisphosphate aldolase